MTDAQRGEMKEKNRKNGMMWFYPRARSVREVSECGCSWTGCHNSAASAMPVHFCLKCMRARDGAHAQETHFIFPDVAKQFF